MIADHAGGQVQRDPERPSLNIVLYHPEIPPNTGDVGRLCVAMGAHLHVVHPIGFSMDAKAVRRAGLDYWQHVPLTEHADEASFWRWAEGRRVQLFSTRGGAAYTECRFEPEDVLVFGKETAGLPRALLAEHPSWHIPMADGPIRSLNLSNAVAVVAYEALRQSRPWIFV